jgi:NitT/TauT family transport system ATP-binding protein
MTSRRAGRAAQKGERATLGTYLPRVSANSIAGLAEALAAAPYDGKADLPEIASELQLEVDELFPVAETMQLLRLAEIGDGDIKLTEIGKRFASEETDERKHIFARLLIRYVPLAAHIRRVLDERESHVAPRTRFLDELEDHMAEESAEETLRSVIAWARFAELFSYDDDSQTFSLENPA